MKKTFICVMVLCIYAQASVRKSCDTALFKEFLNLTKYDYAFDIAIGNACPFGELWIQEGAVHLKDAYLQKLIEPNLLSAFKFASKAHIPCEFNNVHRALYKPSYNVTFAVSYRQENDGRLAIFFVLRLQSKVLEIKVYVIQQSKHKPISFEIVTIPTNVTQILKFIDSVRTAFDASHARLSTYLVSSKENKTVLMTHQFSKVQNRLKAFAIGYDIISGVISNLQLDLSGKYAFLVINGHVYRVFIDFLAHSIFLSDEIVELSLKLGEKDDFIPLNPTTILIWRLRNGQREAIIGENSYTRGVRLNPLFNFYELGCAFDDVPDNEGNHRLRFRQHKRFN